MSRLLGLTYRLRSLLRRSAADRETRDELAYHLECAEKAYVERGMDAASARRRAVAELGGVDAWRDATADVRTGSVPEAIWRDVRFALRSFARRPGFVATVVVTLALGIGANTAVFTLINAVLLKPVPIQDPKRVFAVYQSASTRQPFERTSFAEYKDLATRTRSMSGLAAVAPFSTVLQSREWSDEIQIALVSGNYFPVLGISAVRGRLLGTADESAIGTTPFVVLSYDYWRRKFAGADVIGSTIKLAGNPFTVVGVAPDGFHGTDLSRPPDAWTPVTMNVALNLGAMFSKPELLANRSVPLMYLFGRLKPEVEASSAEAELNALLAAVRAEHPQPRRPAREASAKPMSVVPIARAASIRDRNSLVAFMRILVGAVVMTLLLACVNVANLLIIRGGERARELGVRAALGAGGARLARQLIIENLMLALAGAVAAFGVAWLTVRLLAKFKLPGGIALDHSGLGLDGSILTFTIGLAIITSLVFGLGPAVKASRNDAALLLRGGRDRATDSAPRAWLIVFQVAISLALLVGASLLLRSVRAGVQTDLGFDPAPLVAMDIQPRLLGYSTNRSKALFNEVTRRASSLPGVTSAAAGGAVPLAPAFAIPLSEGAGKTIAGPDGRRRQAPATNTVNVSVFSASVDYFATLAIPIIAGRAFTTTDDANAPQVMIVNQATADAFWPGEPAIGKQLNLFGDYTYTVVGVVPNIKYASLTETNLTAAYVALEQDPGGRATIVARTRNADATLDAMQRLARELNASMPVMNVRRVGSQVDAALMPQRFGATLLTAFSILALGIAVVGLYGAVAYGANRRLGEIGIRMALGARPASILWLLMRGTTLAVVGGVALGTGVAVVSGRALSHFLFGVTPLDPTSFALATVALLCAAAIASLIPALRGGRVDPATSLREM